MRANHVQRFKRRFTRGNAVAFLLGLLDQRFSRQLRGQLRFHAALEFTCFFREGFGVASEAAFPLLLARFTGVAGIPGGVNRLGDMERRVLPAQLLTCQCHFFVTQRCAVSFFFALLVGGTKTDNGFADDQAWLVVMALRQLNGRLDLIRLMAVDVRHHVPAVGLKTLGRIVGKPAFDFAIDRDAVVVIKSNQFAQLLSACQGRRFVGDTLHQAAIAQEAPGVVVNDGVAGAVELRGQGFLGNRETDRVGKALAQRASGGFDARSVAELRVASGGRVQLAEVLQLFQAEFVAAQVQQRVEQHGAVAIRQHEPVAIGPLGVFGVVLEVVIPQHLGNISHTHGGARVAGFGLLNSIHGKGANGIGQLKTGRHGGAPRLKTERIKVLLSLTSPAAANSQGHVVGRTCNSV